jgi:hypothetical protein
MTQTAFAELLSLMDTWIADPKCVEKDRVILAKKCIEQYPLMDIQQSGYLKTLIANKKHRQIIEYCEVIDMRYSDISPGGLTGEPAKAAKGLPAALTRVPATAGKGLPVGLPRMPVMAGKGLPVGLPRMPATAAKAPAVPLITRVWQLFTSLWAILVSLWHTAAAFGTRTWKTVAARVASTWKMCVDQGRESWARVKDGEIQHIVVCISVIILGMATLFFLWYFRSMIFGGLCKIPGAIVESFSGLGVLIAQWLFSFLESVFKSLYDGVTGIPGVVGRVCDAWLLSPAVAFMQLFQRTVNTSSLATGGTVPIEGVAFNTSSLATGGTVPIEGVAFNTSSLATGQCQCQGADKGDYVNSSELGNLRAMVDQLASKLRDHESVTHTPPPPPQQLGSANASNFTVGMDLEVTRAVPQGWNSTIQNLENRLAACEQGNARQDAQIAGLEVTVSNFSVELEKQINVSSILNETILDNLENAHGLFVKFQHIGMFICICLFGIAWGLTWVQKAPFTGDICRALGYAGEAQHVFEPLIERCMVGGGFCLMAVGLVSTVCWA